MRLVLHLAGALALVGTFSGCGVSQTPTGTTSASTAAGPIGLVFKGPYTANTPYGLNDVVNFKGSAYAGLKISMNVPPEGASASAADWGLLVAAGLDGAPGPVGAPGTAGLQGAKGDRGLQGVAGPAGSPGATGSAGATGPQGVAGPTGLTGSPGVAGATGPQGLAGTQGPAGLPGVAGPTGPTGPTGASGAAATAQTVSALRGHGIGILGDSIFAANIAQPVIVARTGAVIAFQDARPGRIFATAFECYGSPARGTAPGTFQPAGKQQCVLPGYVATEGNTLAQNLAGTDMLLLRLGTNDFYLPLGNPGDATTAGTVWGDMRWVVETLLTAKPTLRIILITPELNRFATPAVIQAIVDAEIAYGNSMAIPVLDLYRTSGNNAQTSLVYTSDGTHPNYWSSTFVEGPEIAQFMLRWF